MKFSQTIACCAGVTSLLFALGVLSQSRTGTTDVESVSRPTKDETPKVIAGQTENITTVSLPNIEPLDQQSIYQRALKSPTGMLPTDDSLALFQERIVRNPQDYASWMVMGRLYMRRAEEADDFRDLVRAEEAFDSSLAIHGGHIGSLTFKAICQNKQHKFHEAKSTARQVLKLKPGNFTALAEYGDADFQLGNLKRAEETYRQLHELAETPGSFARLARLAEVRGDLKTAEQHLKAALDLAEEHAQSPTDQAWYHWRLAELAWQQNQIQVCEERLGRVLQLEPQDVAGRVSRAKLLTAMGRTNEAIQITEALIEEDPAPPTLAFLGDLYDVVGQVEKAEASWKRAEEAMAEEATFAGEAHLRERALFLLDHDRELKAALEMTKRDLENRSDIYSHDALAWALYKNGQSSDASKAMKRALLTNSQDPLLQFHALQIFQANNEIQLAQTAAVKLQNSNPQFHPRLGRTVHKYLETLTP